VWLSVSVTTRRPRPGETHGVEYFFVDDAEFDRLVEDGELLEWAEFAGNRYGTPRAPVLARLADGVPALLEIDLQGARQVRASMPEALLVFLAPPSWEVLEDEFDTTLVNNSVQEVCHRLIALMSGSHVSLPDSRT
jgi:guanylate kinase